MALNATAEKSSAAPEPAEWLAALQPFARAADVIPAELHDDTLLFAHFPSLFGGQTEIRVGDLRMARATFAALGGSRP